MNLHKSWLMFHSKAWKIGKIVTVTSNGECEITFTLHSINFDLDSCLLPSSSLSNTSMATWPFQTSKFKMESRVLMEWKFHLTLCLRAPNFHWKLYWFCLWVVVLSQTFWTKLVFEQHTLLPQHTQSSYWPFMYFSLLQKLKCLCYDI